MPGLLDFISTPEGQGLLSAGFGALAGAQRGQPLNTLGRAGLVGVGAYTNAIERQAEQAQLAKRNQVIDLQIAQAQQAQKDAETQRNNEAAFRSSIQSPMQIARDTALGGGGGPTVANAANMPAVDPRAQLLWQAMNAKQIKPMDYINSTAKDNTPIKLAAGETLVTPGSYKPLFTAPNKPEAMPSAIQEYNLAKQEGYQGNFTQWALEQKRAGASNVNVDLKQEGAYRAAQGKEFSDFMAGVNKAGFTAPSQIRKLERMEQLLSGVDGGKLAPTGLDISSAANSVGIKVDPRLGNKEAAQALAREIAGGFRQPGTGSMTDKDFDNFLMQVPDLSKTAEGRKQITATMKSALARDMALAKKAREYEKRHGQVDSGFMDEAAQFIAENPVVGLPQGWRVR